MASANLIGETEKETVLHQLDWMAGWASSLLFQLRTVYMMLLRVQADLSTAADNAEGTTDPASVNACACALQGMLHKLNNKFELGSYTFENREAIWSNLKRSFENLEQQGKGIVPIPIEPIPHEASLQEEWDGDPELMAKHIREALLKLTDIQVDLQQWMRSRYKDDHNAPIVSIAVNVINKQGRDVKTPGIDIGAMIREIAFEKMKKLEEERNTAPASEPETPGESPQS